MANTDEHTIEQIQTRFRGSKLDLTSLSRYEQWALTFFPDSTHITDSCVDMTVQVDITDALQRYRTSSLATEGSFTARLTWALTLAACDVECFCWRRLGDSWYRFENLPLFFPVATGRKERFGEVLLENVSGMEWAEFASIYQKAISRVMETSDDTFNALPEAIWRIAIFVGNLPTLRFTSLRPHQSVARTGRPIFYFGQRYREGERVIIPLAAYFDHANADPVMLTKLIDRFHEYCLM